MSKFEEMPHRFGMSKLGILYSWLFTANLLIWMSLVMIVRERVESSRLLFLLGFIPNFFAALAIFFKILEIQEKKSRLSNFLPKKALGISILTFLILLSGELVQEFLLGGVFDVLDLFASLAGLVLSIFLYQLIQTRINL